MTCDDIIRMAREAGFQTLLPDEHIDGNGGVYVGDDDIAEFLERFAALVAAAERDRTKRLVEDMQSELQTLRDRLAKQKVRIWVYRDNPGITTDREPGNKDLWEPLGDIV